MKTDEKVLEKSMGGWAFYPFLILAGIVVARIIYNIAAGLPQSGNSFPITAVTLVAAVCSLLIGNGKVMERVDAFSKGAADPTAMMMVFIMLLSGAFTSVSQEMGGIESLTNFLLQFIPPNMIYAGILLVTSIISLSIGTSVGSATAMAPIAAGLAAQANLNLPLAISAVLGGASLGDNLSFVSDTTIAATRSQNVGMREKFNFNVKLVIPAFIAAMIIYTVLGMSSANAMPEIGGYNIIKMLPYFYIIIAAVAGMNMMIVLMTVAHYPPIVLYNMGKWMVYRLHKGHPVPRLCHSLDTVSNSSYNSRTVHNPAALYLPVTPLFQTICNRFVVGVLWLGITENSKICRFAHGIPDSRRHLKIHIRRCKRDKLRLAIFFSGIVPAHGACAAPVNDCIKIIFHFFFPPYNAAVFSTFFFPPNKLNWMESKVTITIQDG